MIENEWQEASGLHQRLSQPRREKRCFKSKLSNSLKLIHRNQQLILHPNSSGQNTRKSRQNGMTKNIILGLFHVFIIMVLSTLSLMMETSEKMSLLMKSELPKSPKKNPRRSNLPLHQRPPPRPLRPHPRLHQPQQSPNILQETGPVKILNQLKRTKPPWGSVRAFHVISI